MLFEDLDVWKRSSRLCVDIYKALVELRDFGFKDQINSDKDRVKFLSYAKGSCAELRTQLYIGIEIGYIGKDVGMCWVKETQEISKMLYGLMKALK